MTRWHIWLEFHRWAWGKWKRHGLAADGDWQDAWALHLGWVSITVSRRSKA